MLSAAHADNREGVVALPHGRGLDRHAVERDAVELVARQRHERDDLRLLALTVDLDLDGLVARRDAALQLDVRHPAEEVVARQVLLGVDARGLRGHVELVQQQRRHPEVKVELLAPGAGVGQPPLRHPVELPAGARVRAAREPLGGAALVRPRVLDHVLPDEHAAVAVQFEAAQVQADGHRLRRLRVVDEGQQIALVALPPDRVGLDVRVPVALPVRAVAHVRDGAVADLVGRLRVRPARDLIPVGQRRDPAQRQHAVDVVARERVGVVERDDARRRPGGQEALHHAGDAGEVPPVALSEL